MRTGKFDMKTVMKSGYAFAFIFFATFSLFIGGCNADGPGIFYTISQVVPQSDTAISDLNVKSLVEDGDGNLYAGAGASVWKLSGSSWTNITPAGMGASPEIATDGTDVYAALYSESDANRVKSVYRYSGSGSDWGNSLSDSPTGVTLQLLNTSGDFFAVVSNDNSSYAVYQSAAFTLISGITDYVFDAAYDGTSAYLLAGGASDTPKAWHSGDYTTAITSFSSGLGGVCHDGSSFYISTRDGNVYGYDGSTLGSPVTAPDNYSGNTPVLHDIVHLGDNEGIMVIGSDEGYYEFDNSGTPVIRRPESTIGSVDIEAAYPDFAFGMVRTFLNTSGAGFFLGTGSGVWENNGSTLSQK